MHLGQRKRCRLAAIAAGQAAAPIDEAEARRVAGWTRYRHTGRQPRGQLMQYLHPGWIQVGTHIRLKLRLAIEGCGFADLQRPQDFGYIADAFEHDVRSVPLAGTHGR